MNDLSKGRILVTGGAGFIGSALIWELNRRGFDDILVSDVLGRDEKWKNLVALKFADYIEADELRKSLESSENAFSDLKTIFHLGACSATTETDATYLIRNNFEYTKMLAHAAVARQTRFLYASSAATYGSLEEAVPETLPLTMLRPLNMYGYSKHLFDRYAEEAGILPRITGLKYFNVYGPNEHHKGDMRSMVHKAFHQIRQTNSITLFKSHRPDYADGEQRRDFFYVKNAVAATIFLAEHVDGCGLFNLGSGKSHTWLDMANALYKALSLEPEIKFIDMPEALRPKYQYFTRADVRKLRAAGFTEVFTPLEAGVADYVQNYLTTGKYLGDEAVRP